MLHLISYHCLARSLSSRHTGFLSAPWLCSHLRVFAFAVTSLECFSPDFAHLIPILYWKLSINCTFLERPSVTTQFKHPPFTIYSLAPTITEWGFLGCNQQKATFSAIMERQGELICFKAMLWSRKRKLSHSWSPAEESPCPSGGSSVEEWVGECCLRWLLVKRTFWWQSKTLGLLLWPRSWGGEWRGRGKSSEKDDWGRNIPKSSWTKKN